MIRRTFNVGEIITITRTTFGGTGYHYALTHLSGKIAYVGETVEPSDEKKFGGEIVQTFSFQFLDPGEAEIQFAYYRDVEKVEYEDVYSYTVVAAPLEDFAAAEGAWSQYRPLTAKDKEIIDACIMLEGVGYFPIMVSQQVVNGTNYRYICIAKVVSPGSKYYFAKVTIHAPLEGKPVLQSIVEY